MSHIIVEADWKCPYCGIRGRQSVWKAYSWLEVFDEQLFEDLDMKDNLFTRRDRNGGSVQTLRR